MYNIFIFTMIILIFFVGLNLILYRYEFYNKMSLGKRNFLAYLYLSIFLIFYKIFIFTLYSLQDKSIDKRYFHISMCTYSNASMLIYWV